MARRGTPQTGIEEIEEVVEEPSKGVLVPDIPDDFEIDDADIDDSPAGITQLDDGPDFGPDSAVMATTSNFYNDPNTAAFQPTPEQLAAMNPDPSVPDDVIELQSVVLEPAKPKRKVRTNADVGPIYYGHEEVELKKGILYAVPEHIFEYLRERGLIYSVS